ncbi:hypothetical protein N8975_05945 [Candidatus Pelagibacter ubique]|nr:hypothetical protein [Candidatus Pelagibacter ubique]
MTLIKKKKKISSLFVLILSIIFLYSCSKTNNKLEFQEACYFKKVDGKEVLICDEERMNKVKVQTNPYSNEFKICDKYQYSTEIDGEIKIKTGIRCPTQSSYEIIK